MLLKPENCIDISDMYDDTNNIYTKALFYIKSDIVKTFRPLEI